MVPYRDRTQTQGTEIPMDCEGNPERTRDTYVPSRWISYMGIVILQPMIWTNQLYQKGAYPSGICQPHWTFSML
ncbi:hypothetical protein AFLA_008124 [Aspergillus flavus NRRL3357]|nr:hypothetical protein AFLA_008124 [Aspergillus flavus NRRL3357]